MARPYGSRTLLAICVALILLLGALAAVQYQWSTRVAAADAQREREHLNSSAALFAGDFNTLARQAVSFLQNSAWGALQSGAPLTGVPKLIGELYFLDSSSAGPPKAERLNPAGAFVSADLPPWASSLRCAAVIIDQPPALIVPIFQIQTTATNAQRTLRIVSTPHDPPGRCFLARLDLAYLRDTLFPQMIHRSFGPTSAAEYDFAIAPAGKHAAPLYGTPQRADLRQPFLSVMPGDAGFGRGPAPAAPKPGESMVIVQRVESTIVGKSTAGIAPLFGPGAWELEVAHKGVPLADAFQQTRRRNLLLSLLVEALLIAAVVFLLVAARRMQKLADQKMQFVAGVSHELRTPVSAIAMLSRNQADGLVTGPDRVQQYGELIHQQSRRLNEMVEQTLQYAGIHSGLRPLAKNAVDLRHLIEDTVEARRAELSRSGIEVELALDPGLASIQGDPHWLRTALDNLLSNAQKHAGAGRWIRVSAAHVPGAKEVRIAVEDRGAGIDPADQAEIFEPFNRGRAAIEAQIPGSGLGLSLVRSAAQVHHGTVTLESQPGRGSIFTLHLPV